MDQQKAIQGALDHDIAVITGPAGSGKTTCLDEVIYNLDLRGIKHLDCSFTGKAVARMREVTHTREPCTIHVAIKESPMGMGRVKTGLPSIDNPSRELVDVSPEVILMDEACTTSGPLMMGIMRAYPMTKRWIFFCDPNQLKPIEYLSVIENLIEAEVMPHYRLRTNFRVKTADGQTDGIIQNTTAIINHDIEYPFSFVTSHSNFQIIEGGIQQVMDLLFFFHRENVPADKIVIITPFKDLLPELNVGFQAIYDLGGQFAVDTRGVKWQMGDRVMLTKNDYEINVFNGEQGNVIRNISPRKRTITMMPLMSVQCYA
jgi:exodeoxyribonuclease V alpha subunit